MKTVNCKKEAKMRHIVFMASLALVTITSANNASAEGCALCDSKFVVKAGEAYDKCVAALCGKKEPEVIPTAPTVPTAPTAKPCPYYMGKSVTECPQGCPDKRMDIAGDTCKCPREMKLSRGNTCVCTGGLVASGKKCVEPSQPDCGTCQHVIEDLLAQTRFCDSQGVWYFSEEEYTKNCKPCPKGQISTGWKCITIPAGIAASRGFFYWPPDCWDLFPLILFLILLVIILLKKTGADLKLKRIISDFSRKEISPHRERLCQLEKTAYSARAEELQFGLLPDLKRRLAAARKEEKDSKDAVIGGEKKLKELQETVEIAQTDLDNLSPSEQALLQRGSLTPELRTKKERRDKATVALTQFQTVWAESASQLSGARSNAGNKVRDLDDQIDKVEKEIRELRVNIARADSEIQHLRRASR